jgi:hypothetical protein
MNSSCIPAVLFVLAATKLSVCGAQVFDQTPVYEALFSQVDLLGLDRTYYIGEMEVRPEFFAIPAGFRIPAEIDAHATDDFGNVSVSLVEESFLTGLWDSSCAEGWASFHERYPDPMRHRVDLASAARSSIYTASRESSVWSRKRS